MQTSPREQPAGRRLDAGVSLIEVMVAMLVFAILSTGIVAGMVTITRMTDDNKARVAASGLAAQDIALVRAVGDPFTLAGASGSTTTSTAVAVGSRTYTVQRQVNLVSSTGADATCASSDVFYARVNVRVTWPGQLARTQPVQDDTIVASQGRINDSATGSITVSVIGADGSPEQGITVRMAPTSGGAALTTQPADTDVNGCTRAIGLTPGTYTVTLTKTGFKDVNQVDSPSKTVIITAGANQAISFQYDATATYRTNYIPWPQDYAPSNTAVLLPTNLDTTFINSTSGAYTTAAPAASVALHPFPSGYTAIAGTPGTAGTATACAATDPRAWQASTSGGPSRATGVAATGAVGSGQSTDFFTTYGSTTRKGIPMGVVELKNTLAVVATLITATTTTPPSGTANPGCSTTKTYSFSPGLTAASKIGLLLPYGSYTINITLAGLVSSQVPASNLSVPSNIASDGVSNSGVVTLDPRPMQ